MERDYKMVYKVTTTQYFQEDLAKIGNFHAQMRDLWNDYIWRNRSHLVAAMNSTPEMMAAREWVTANITDYYNVIKDYYDADSAQRFRDILESQVTDLIQLLDYIKKPPVNFNINTDTFVQEIVARLNTNATEMFEFLATVNSGAWNTINLKNQLLDLVEAWLSQIKMRMIKNWNEDLAATDKSFDVARQIAHQFATGIVEQNPDRFAISS
jgi:hypothetical protein